MNRPLTAAEKQLIRWMLEHGKPEARAFLPQLEQAEVAPWRCKCGCASIELVIQNNLTHSGGIHPIADFIFGADEELSGIFVFERNGVLAGLEVYGLAGDAPKLLPTTDSLRSFPESVPPRSSRSPGRRTLTLLTLRLTFSGNGDRLGLRESHLIRMIGARNARNF
jgi:hypothetical protein